MSSGVGGVVLPPGPRMAMMELADDAPSYLRAQISQPEWREWWLNAFQVRLRRAERDAVRLYPELLRMVGANDAALEVALRALGVSLDAARIAVGAYQQVQGMDAAQAADFSLARLQEHYAAQGKRLVLLDNAGAEGAEFVAGPPASISAPRNIEPGGSDPAGAAPALPTAVPGLNNATEGGNGNGAS